MGFLNFSNFRFVSPYFLLLIILVPFIFRWRYRKKGSGGNIKFSSISFFKGKPQSLRSQLYIMLPLLESLGILFLIIALARPQTGTEKRDIYSEAVDIVLTMDVSSSMKAVDFKPKNRLEAAKKVGSEFIKGRKNDRIGLVLFAAKSFTQCPLTIDYGILHEFIKKMEIGMIKDGTAIGMGLATAVNRLKDSKAKSKVIILLTDGRNNRGKIAPITAAQMASKLDITIYAIGMGKRGKAMYPRKHPVLGKRYVKMPVQLNEQSLKEIASVTDGKYFRATDTEKLKEIYDRIDQMERTKIKIKKYTEYNEQFPFFLWIGLILILAELTLSRTIFLKIP